MSFKIYPSFLFIFFLHISCEAPIEPVEKRVLSFVIEGYATAKTVIDQQNNSITIVLPYNTYLKELKPIFELSPAIVSVPASGKVQDFSKPIYYTLTASDGSKSIYTVIVTTQPQPQPQIISIEKDSIEAGQDLKVVGKYFGNFSLDIKANLIDKLNNKLPLAVTYIDSTQLKLSVASSTPPANYKIELSVKNLTSVSNQTIEIVYPTPQIKRLIKNNILQGDTLQVEAEFVDKRYMFALIIGGQSLNVIKNDQRTLSVVIPTSLKEGIYQLAILNTQTGKQSPMTTQTIRIYDIEKPFVYGLINAKPTYQPTQKIELRTHNFKAFPTRFYQLQLESSTQTYLQNGVYDSKTSTLSYTVPSNIAKGTYRLSISLVTSLGENYNIDIDDMLTVQ